MTRSGEGRGQERSSNFKVGSSVDSGDISRKGAEGRAESKVKGREDSEVNSDIMVFRCLISAREIQQAFGTEHRIRKEE